MESGGRDPQSGLGYTYLRFKDKKSVQLMAMMESEGWGTKLAMRDDLSPLSGTAYAAEDYSDKHPGTFGKKIGVFADCTNNSPLQEIATYTGSGMNASIAATGTGICVYGNTSSGSRELLSST